ncbi:MAG: tetratricopeptide repeat protein [Planctomycetota bacterium]|jgi:tetratricopeptide (TPR) repeat protein
MNKDEPKKPGSAMTSGLIAAAVLTVIAIAAYVALRPAPEAPTEGQPPEAWTAEQRKRVEEVHAAVNQYIETNKLAEAGVILDKHLVDYPLDPQGHYLMAKLLIADNRKDQAYGYLRQSLRLDPNQPIAEFESGLILYEEYPGDAMQHYFNAMTLDPSEPRYPLYLGQAQLQERNYDEAKKLTNQALALNSSLPQAYSILAEIDARQGNLTGAIANINQALELMTQGDPYYPDYMLIKAKYLRDSEEHEAALRVIYALPVEQLEREAVVNQLTATYALMDRYDKAAVIWEKFYYDNKQNTRAAAETGLAYLKAGDRAKAKTYLAIGQRLDKLNHKVEELEFAIENDSP